MLFKEFKVKYKEDEANNGVICGYASTWDEVPDAYGDIVKKGAFENSLKKIYEEGRTIPFLWSHKMDDLDAYIGSCEAHEDDKGLYFEATLDDTPQAQRVRELFKSGRLSKFSFAYDIIDEEPITLDNGLRVNCLNELELYEITACLVPANSFAEVVDVKSNDNAKKDNGKKEDNEVLNEVISLLNQAIDKVTEYKSDGESNSEDNSEVNDEQSEEQKNIVNEVKSTEEQTKLLQIINNVEKGE